jgi:hypothetical protein
MIPLSLVSDFVLAHVVCNAKASDAKNNDLSSQVDTVANGVSWCIANEVCPARHCQQFRRGKYASVGKTLTWQERRLTSQLTRSTRLQQLVLLVQQSLLGISISTTFVHVMDLLLMPHDKKPGPPGKAPVVMK